MADSVLTSLTGLTSPVGGDLLYVVDVSDTTESAAGTEKKITVTTLLSVLDLTSPTISDPTITGGTTMTVADTGNAVAVTINQNDVTNDPVAVDVNQTSNGVALEIDNDGTNHAVYIHQDGVSASGDMALYVYSNAAQVTEDLVEFKQDNASSDKNVFNIVNDGTGYSLLVDQNGNGTPLYIDNAGTSTAVNIQQSGVLSSAYALYVYSNAVQNASPLTKVHLDNASSDQDVTQVVNDGTGNAVVVTQTGVLAAGSHALHVYSNAAQVSDTLVAIESDNASSTKNAVKIQNDGTGTALLIDQNGNGIALDIDSEVANSGSVIRVSPAGTSPGAFNVFRRDEANGNIVLRIGAHFLWIDSTGDVRTHTSLPANDTDGTIVGTQS